MQLDPHLDDPPGVVQLRYTSQKVSVHWKDKPSPDCLHLIVRVLPSKRLKRHSMLLEDSDEG